MSFEKLRCCSTWWWYSILCHKVVAFYEVYPCKMKATKEWKWDFENKVNVLVGEDGWLLQGISRDMISKHQCTMLHSPKQEGRAMPFLPLKWANQPKKDQNIQTAKLNWIRLNEPSSTGLHLHSLSSLKKIYVELIMIVLWPSPRMSDINFGLTLLIICISLKRIACATYLPTRISAGLWDGAI